MINSAESAVQALEERERLVQQHQKQAEPDGDATPTQVTTASFDPSLGPKRSKGVAYTRWDTTTSSEFSDWR